MRGIELFLEILHASGVRTLFGNPGTSELPLNDALARDSRFTYVLGLQEIPVMGMADGFAMASGSLAVVNLHIACGLGNAMGLLYNAYREGSPLLVTAGQQDRRLAIEEPILYGDLVDVARPWTKFSAEVHRMEQLPVLLRRAIQAALTPPTGPVFLSLPMDLQMELVGEPADVRPPPIPDSRVRPPQEALEVAARLMVSAKRPAILAGSRVVERRAVDALTTLARQWGAPVWTEPAYTLGRLPIRSDDPMFAGLLPFWAPQIHDRLEPYDVILVTGMDLMRQYVYHEPNQLIPSHVRVIHLDEDARELNKNYLADAPLLGDTREGLTLLSELLAAQMTERETQRAQSRRAQQTRTHESDRANTEAQIDAQRGRRPMAPSELMACVANVLPADSAVVEAAVTTTGTLLHRLGALRNPAGYFAHRGWTLGWGLNVTLGVKLAWPDLPVLGLIGDGAALYGIQGLWSAAHYNIGATMVVCNNAQYRILKVGGKGLGLAAATQDALVGMDLNQPTIDFVALATSLGVRAARLTEPDEIQDALRDSLRANRPCLLDIPVDPGMPAGTDVLDH